MRVDTNGRHCTSRLALCAGFLLLAAAAGAQTPERTSTVVVRAARLIDGTGANPIDDATIVVRDGRIGAAGPSATTPVPAGAVVIDYHGATIIPGLISDHVHLGIVDGIQVDSTSDSRASILAQLAQFEAYGVTTIAALGLNGPRFYELRPELRAGRLAGADMFGADRGISLPNGAPPFPVGTRQLDRPDSPEGARRAVRDMAARGADLIKLWLDDFDESLPKMEPDIYRAVIDEAHRHGLRVAAHIHNLGDARAVVLAGADILAHGVRDSLVDAEFVRLLKDRSVWYIPTLSLDEATFVYAEAPAWTRTPFVLRAVSPALRTRLDDPVWRATTRASPQAAAARRSLATNQRNLRILYDAGVQIGFGTDAGAQPTRIPGVAEHRELALMVQAGLTPLHAITIATSRAAALLELDDRGILASGRLADFVVLGADPSTDIDATTQILAVWHRGREVADAR